jgi:hypothetical protein
VSDGAGRAAAAPPRRRRSRWLSRWAAFNLIVAFSFTVMADPVSSVTYAIEAALGRLGGDLRSLLPTMAVVVATIGVVAAGYHQLIRRFPAGGCGPKGLAAAFGEGWAFLPLGALIVDFTLTAASSCAAAASAAIAYLPALADARVLVAVGLAGVVAGGCAFGHRGRVAFATATLAFVGLALVVIVRGAGVAPAPGAPPIVGEAALVPVLLAMPLGMALATGVEAPSDAIAQLGELDDDGRRRFGQLTLWLMLGIVGALTLALAALAVRLGVAAPGPDSTLLADVARRGARSEPLFAAFQAASALLLLAAAASSYLAGSGLLKALALHGGDGDGLLPRRFGRVNRFHAPVWGIGALAVVTILLVVAAGGRDQRIVQFYAVAVFASFLGALVAAARLAQRDRRWVAAGVDAISVVLVAFVLALNLERVDPIASLLAAAAVSLYLWRAWVSRGRPGDVSAVVR